MRKIIIILTLFSLTACGKFTNRLLGTEGNPKNSSSQPTSVYIVAGQSNMDNWLISMGLPSGARGYYPLVWEGQDVIFIPSARGGTALNSWIIDEFGLYSQIINTVRSLPDNSQLKGIIWYQGESDTYHESDAITYASRLASFMTKLRHDIGEPNLPLIYARISGDNLGFEANYEIVRQQQEYLNLRYSKMINTDDLDHLPMPNVHLSAQGYKDLGTRFFEATK